MYKYCKQPKKILQINKHNQRLRTLEKNTLLDSKTGIVIVILVKTDKQ